jgi:hypothetical protein
MPYSFTFDEVSDYRLHFPSKIEAMSEPLLKLSSGLM